MSVWPGRPLVRCESPLLSSSTLQVGEPRKRASSDVAAKPRIRLLSSGEDPARPANSPRLVDRLLSNQSKPQFLHPHSHSASKAESGAALTPIITTHSNMASIAKAHNSPSKASYNRTYEPKLVSREMHRLGNLAHGHLPSSLTPSISQGSSSSTLNLPASSTLSQVNLTNPTADPWGALHVYVLPLFNGEPLRIAIEDLNVLVRKHISSVISSAPSKALTSLEHDASELIASGMATLNAKLTGVDEDKLVSRVVEIWGFFWDQVLTYLEGVLLPLQTEPILSSLHRTPKRPSSPNRSTQKGSISGITLNTAAYPIDVRTVALRAFRDKVILPRSTKLYSRLSMFNKQESFQDSSYQQPRLQQMLLVLSAQGRQRPSTLSLTSSTPTPSQGEAAIADLLRLVRTPRPSDPRAPRSPIGQQSRASTTFLSGAIPRDRRGRVATKQKANRVTQAGLIGTKGLGLSFDDEDFSDNETPRIMELEKERERALLESLRSPGPDSATRTTAGGWGLGITHDDPGKVAEEEDEPELNWDQAQALVEKMVGMTSQSQPPDTPRRRS